MILPKLRMTRSAGKEMSTSIPSPSRLKSLTVFEGKHLPGNASGTFSSRNARPSVARQWFARKP